MAGEWEEGKPTERSKAEGHSDTSEKAGDCSSFC